MKKLKKIPKSFKLFADTINIVWDNKRMNDKENYGEASYGERKITLSTTQGTDELAQDCILSTFYHEVVHMILLELRRDDLSQDEKFVDNFAKLLRQFIESQQYE
jgi:hypothetical protein